ncbi:UNVERIFIED_CONTAM: thioredoxin, putative [Hammondia hammondi]|eukprot:XP_008886392.1 thioredoxin, putative [Hammondia hammondi]
MSRRLPPRCFFASQAVAVRAASLPQVPGRFRGFLAFCGALSSSCANSPLHAHARSASWASRLSSDTRVSSPSSTADCNSTERALQRDARLRALLAPLRLEVAHAFGSAASPSSRDRKFFSSRASEGRDAAVDSASRSNIEEMKEPEQANAKANEGEKKATETKGTHGKSESVGAGEAVHRSGLRRVLARLVYSCVLLIGGGTAFLFFAFPAAPLELKNSPVGSALQAALQAARRAALGGKETPEETGDRKPETGRKETRSPFAFLTRQDPLEGFSLVTDAEFDTTDEALVLFLDGETQAEEESEAIRKLRALVERMQQERNLKSIRLFYAWRTAGNSPAQGEDTAVMLYKGQRRSRYALGELLRGEAEEGGAADSEDKSGETEERGEERTSPREAASGQKILETFFTPLSEKENATRTKREKENHLPIRVVGAAFKRDVLDEAKAGNTILLQLFEDSCFLCFLMRPFLNSVSALLAEYNIPVTMKRLNIEKNDFPEGCVVTRSTPTFVLHRGGHEEGEKWSEFRPRDFIEKLEKEFDLPVELREKMHALLDLLHERFKRFGLLSVWLLEVRKMEEAFLQEQQRKQARDSLELHGLGAPTPSSSPSLSSAPSSPGDHQTGAREKAADEASREQNEKQREDGAFDAIVSMLMSQDMKRFDDLGENLEHLEREAANAEADAMALGVMMGEEVLRDDVEHLADALLAAESLVGQSPSVEDGARRH